MTPEKYRKLVYAEKLTGPENTSVILEWLSHKRDLDPWLFAKVGHHGSKFTYCHLAVVKRTTKNYVDVHVRMQGWRYVGTVGRAAAYAEEVPASLFDGHVGESYRWSMESSSVIFPDGREIDYAASAPVELWDTVNKCRREIVQLLGDDWELLVSDLGYGYVDYAHVLILPYQAGEAGEQNAA